MPPFSTSLRAALAVLVAVLISLELWFLVDMDAILHVGVGAPGTYDFQSYWTGFRAVLEHQDPYDPAVVGPRQVALGHDHIPVVMYNPPWTLGFMAPILALPFPVAAMSWMALTFVAAPILAGWGLRQLELPETAAVAAIAFHPLISSALWGQASPLATLGLGLAWVALRSGRDTLAGVGLALATTKPHLALPFGVAALWTAVVDRRPRILVGALAAFVPALGLTLAWSPAVLGQWIDSFRALSEGSTAVASTDFRTASLANQLMAWTGISAFRWALPALGIAGTVGWLLRLRAPVPWATAGPWLLGIGFLTAPFGWLYDMTTLLWLQVLPVAYGLARHDPRPVVAVAVVQAVSVGGQAAGVFVLQHHFWWMPAAMLGVWAATFRLAPPISR